MTTVLHDQDFYAWTQQQAQLLKSGQFFKALYGFQGLLLN
jgi:hypothetical protein